MAKPIVFDATSLPDEQPSETLNSSEHIGSIEAAQEIIYSFLLDIVKQQSPEIVLQEFKNLFIQDTDSSNSKSIQAIYEIVFANKQEDFHYTIKRSCYILLNNWIAKRKPQYIQQLIEILNDPIIRRRSLSPIIARLRNWIQLFVSSQDYQELELYAQTKVQQEQRKSSNRYTSLLLATQYNNIDNPIEQREAARNRAQQLKFRFKFDLAMYMARFESASVNHHLKNPTEVGDEVLRIIKIIAAKRDGASYTNFAEAFVKQAQQQNYQEFKQSLQKYLMCNGESQKFIDILNSTLSQKIEFLYKGYEEKKPTEAMILKTCNKLIDSLTTEDRQKPSGLLVSLISEGHPLTVVVLLIKIVLICRPTRTHLESCMADLIRYYEKYPEKCGWMINFVEIYNIMFAIYADEMSMPFI